MGSLLLIRHAQASLGAADYDVLSPLGIEQSRRLGEHIGRRGLTFDRLACGPLRRHRDTATHMIEGASALGLRLPEPTPIPELDEFPALEILETCVDELAAEDEAIASLRAAFSAVDPGDPLAFRRTFEPLFQALMRRWIDGALDHRVEPYASFQARVVRGTQRLLAGSKRGARIAAVTSAGPVGAALRVALNLAPWDAMRATFVVANTSLTEFKHRPGELSVVGFNALPHLDADRLITLR